MTRVYPRAIAASRERDVHKIRDRKKKPYKIVLESVTQEKKKLLSSVSYDPRAPPGYTFVPVGIPDLTQQCIEFCISKGLHAHIVSAAPKNKAQNDPGKISHHTHRVGYHFPSAVVDQACDWLGYNSRRGRLYRQLPKDSEDSRLARRLAVHSRHETSEQIRAAVRDLFPKIPEADLKAIVKHAFREGTSRVGNAAELPLARRVQLAVIAHIRHEYTEYDKLLKTGTYLEARAKVEPASLEQLRKWRGENDDGPVELEDVFREIIVLDDDADSDDSDDDSSSDDPADERASSFEIISNQAAGHDLRAEDVFGAQQRVVDDAGQVMRRAYIALPRPRPAITVRGPRAYSTYTGQPDDIARRPCALNGYLPRPSDHRLYARLPERLAQPMRYLSPPLEGHMRTQQGNCAATYPRMHQRPIITSGREGAAPRSHTPPVRVYAEADEGFITDRSQDSSSQPLYRTTREYIPRSGPVLERFPPLQITRSSPAQYPQPIHTYSYAGVNTQRASRIDNSYVVDFKKLQLGYAPVDAPQIHEREFVVTSIENDESARTGPSTYPPVSLAGNPRYQEAIEHADYPAYIPSAHVRQYPGVVRLGKQKQHQSICPQLIPRRESWPMQQNTSDHDSSEGTTYKRLKLDNGTGKQRMKHEVPISQPSKGPFGIDQNTHHDGPDRAIHAAIVDLTTSPHKTRNLQCDAPAYAEPYDRNLSSMMTPDGRTRRQVLRRGEPATTQMHTHQVPSGRGTVQNAREHFDQAPLLPLTDRESRQGAAVLGQQVPVMSHISGRDRARSDAHNNGHLEQSFRTEVTARRDEQQRSVPGYTPNMCNITYHPTPEQSRPQLLPTYGFSLPAYSYTMTDDTATRQPAKFMVSPDRAHAYRSPYPNQYYGNESAP